MNKTPITIPVLRKHSVVQSPTERAQSFLKTALLSPIVKTAAIAASCLLSALPYARAAGAPDANSVLILNTTVSGGASSVEAVEAANAGFTVEVVDGATWGAKTTAEFKTYRALILGDATCTSVFAAADAEANSDTWGAAIDGNVLLIGTDEVYHDSQGGRALSVNGIKFVGNIPGKTGMFISLSCYYASSAPGTPVPLLNPFGVFTVRDPGDCYNDSHIVATHPALDGITDASLSNWSCSVHEAFEVFPTGSGASDFKPLAIAENQGGTGSLTFPDGTFGVPYILARGEGLVVISAITLTPGNAENPVGTSHTVTAKVITNSPTPGTPVVGTTVSFSVVSGPNSGANGSGVTDNNGEAQFTYTGSGGPGTDNILATFVDATGATQTSNVAVKKWVGTPTLEVIPETATEVVGTPRCTDALLKDGDGNPLAGVSVSFVVTGVNPTSGSAVTNASGVATFCYTGTTAGLDTVTASAQGLSDTGTITWTRPGGHGHGGHEPHPPTHGHGTRSVRSR